MFKSIIVKPTVPHTATILFMHGLGDTGNGWQQVAQELAPFIPHVKFILPRANNQPVTLNGRMPMASWFDLYTLDDRDGRHDEAGILNSVQGIQQLVDNEIKAGIPTNRIVIGGFSQGSALAMVFACLNKERFAGVMGLSGFLPMADRLPDLMRGLKACGNLETPFQMFHGEADPIVQCVWGRQSFERLKQLGFKAIEFKTYRGMGHSSSDQEIDDMKLFLSKVIP